MEMEENTPRARDPRPPFSRPEAPAARPARRGTPPAVTFQPPRPGESAEGHYSHPQATPAAPEPAPKAPAKKAAPAKRAAPAKKAAKKAAPIPAPAKKATRPRRPVAPQPEPAPALQPVEAPPADAPRRTIAVPVDLWSRLRADPKTAPETLAATAVELIGPRAQAWVTDLRTTYPTATPEALARLATRRFTRSADLRAALSAFAGPYAPVALLATALITHAELVLHVAAAYGRDPADPRRAADLLALTRVEPDGAKRLAGTTAAWAALRYTGRAFPGGSLVAAVLTSRSAAEAVAVRARRHYARPE